MMEPTLAGAPPELTAVAMVHLSGYDREEPRTALLVALSTVGAELKPRSTSLVVKENTATIEPHYAALKVVRGVAERPRPVAERPPPDSTEPADQRTWARGPRVTRRARADGRPLDQWPHKMYSATQRS
jgi:hypothetical protein